MNSDQAAMIESLFQAHYSELQVYAYRFLGNWDAAAQAVQETFHIACEKIDALQDSPNQIGWLKNTTRYVCLNTIKTKNRQMKLLVAIEEVSPKQLPSINDVYSIENEDALKSILLDIEFQLIFETIIQGIPYTTVAQKHGITMWACRKRVQRIIKKLRDYLSQRKNFSNQDVQN